MKENGGVDLGRRGDGEGARRGGGGGNNVWEVLHERRINIKIKIKEINSKKNLETCHFREKKSGLKS